MTTDPRYMSFDHKYVETINLPKNRWATPIPPYRIVTRAGLYPAAGAYGGGVTIYSAPVESELNYAGYALRPENLPTFNGVSYTDLDLKDLRTASNPTGTVRNLTEALAGAVTYPQNHIVFDPETNNFYYVIGAGGLVYAAAAASLSAARTTLLAGVGTSVALIPDLQEIYKGSSTTPHKPSILKYQRDISIVTDGIAIVQVDPTSAAISVDSAIFAGNANGLATVTAGAGVRIGRSLDAVATPGNGNAYYIRLKLGSI